MKKKTSAGMTLIEVMIVVGTLVVLMTALMVSILPALAKGRDGRRKADLERISKALEEYYNDNGGYPASLDTCGRGTVLAPYLADVPCDPITKEEYTYYVNTDDQCTPLCRSYTLYTNLDNKKDPQIEKIGCGGASGCYTSAPPSNTKYNYGVASSNRSVKR